MTPAPALFLALPGNEDFAARLAAELAAETGQIECRRFPDGETYIRLLSSVTGRRVVLVATLANPDPLFVGLALTAEAARAQGASAVYLVAPYLAYMRQDKSFKSGEAVSSITFARLISGLFDGLVTVDPHLHRRTALSEIYSIPSVAVEAAAALADWVAANVRDPILVGPDSESAQWVSAVANRVKAPWQVMTKTRRGDYDVTLVAPDLSQHSGCTPVLLDDIASSGRTLIAASEALARAGMARPVVAVVHPLFVADSFKRLQSIAARVVSSDSIAHPTNAIPLAPVLAPALAKMVNAPTAGGS